MKNSILSLLACISLSACQSQAETPKQVAEKYWQALKNSDAETARQLVSLDSLHSLDTYLKRASEDKLPLDNIELGSEYAGVDTTVTIKDNNSKLNQSSTNDQRISLKTILILENGQWKIDAVRTQLPAMKKTESHASREQLSEAFKENIESIDKTLEEGAEVLNEFMQEGSKEMGDTLLKGMNKMNEALRDAVEKMKQRREQQDIPEPPAHESGENGEGLI